MGLIQEEEEEEVKRAIKGEHAQYAHKSDFTAVFRYKGSDRPETMALKKMLKLLLRSFEFECREIVEGNWRERTLAGSPRQSNGEESEPSNPVAVRPEGQTREIASGAK